MELSCRLPPVSQDGGAVTDNCVSFDVSKMCLHSQMFLIALFTIQTNIVHTQEWKNVQQWCVLPSEIVYIIVFALHICFSGILYTRNTTLVQVAGIPI